MLNSRFIQIHYLTGYSATLLNRDDAGLAKRLPFGGTTRTRVSSQCLKRHWRTAEDSHALAALQNVEMSLRSRHIFDEKVARPLIEQEGLDRKKVEAAVAAFQDQLLGSSARAKKEKKEKSEKGEKGETSTYLQTSQVVILGWPEVRFIQDKVRTILAGAADIDAVNKGIEALFNAEGKKNMKALLAAAQLPAGLDAALFGRMVTSDFLARLDAAIHVAHAFTVHEHELETDYFSALDDLLQESGELGSGHINDSELTSGIFYGYVVVDVPLLVSNLTGCQREGWESADRTLPARVVENLLHLIATVSPGAKKGATAPYAYAEMLLVESGNRQPRTLANAFRKPVPNKGREDVRDVAIAQLGDYLKKFDAMYGGGEVRKVVSMADTSALHAESVAGLDELARWSANQIRGVA
ncbi:MAG: type I-E CRISPR-associated protein Cas7/Cse4/CasC [Magnetococcales bacterium]|nr:type I-E CRISPR-associated protein Cas7/Cse4/CasC [Magnetococcales bacterium]